MLIINENKVIHYRYVRFSRDQNSMYISLVSLADLPATGHYICSKEALNSVNLLSESIEYVDSLVFSLFCVIINRL